MTLQISAFPKAQLVHRDLLSDKSNGTSKDALELSSVPYITLFFLWILSLLRVLSNHSAVADRGTNTAPWGSDFIWNPLACVREGTRLKH
jgi:hypothetical protein